MFEARLDYIQLNCVLPSLLHKSKSNGVSSSNHDLLAEHSITDLEYFIALFSTYLH